MSGPRRLTVTILGCGSSAGVPRVGQGWGACDPRNPRNRRRRCGLLVSQGAEGAPASACTQLLVDMSPDLREQLLASDVRHLDAIMMTHAHADHLHGIDDVRPLAQTAKSRIPVYMDDATAAEVLAKFGYIFQTPPGSSYPPLLADRRLTPGAPVAIDGPGGVIQVTPIRVRHGRIDALGFRFGPIAYTPDVSAIPDTSADALRNLDLWIIDALRYRRHPTHICVEEALAYASALGARRTILTNLNADLDYATLADELPANVEPAYDGMQIVMERVDA